MSDPGIIQATPEIAAAIQKWQALAKQLANDPHKTDMDKYQKSVYDMLGQIADASVYCWGELEDAIDS